MEAYYEYSSHKTRDAAERALDHYYATDIVCEAERPEIKSRKARDGKSTVYAVMFREIY